MPPRLDKAFGRQRRDGHLVCASPDTEEARSPLDAPQVGPPTLTHCMHGPPTVIMCLIPAHLDALSIY